MNKLARFCKRHPDRPAIGVCVITGTAICAECSTQYQGVNYSKQGLAQYLEGQRAKAKGGRSVQSMGILLLIASPGALYLAWLGFEVLGQLAIDLIQVEGNGGWD